MPKVILHYGVDYDDGNGTRPILNANGEAVEKEVSGDGVHIQEFTVAASSSQVLYSSSEDISSFLVGFVVSDSDDVMLELFTDLDNSVGDEVYTVELAADIPFILGSDDSYANYTRAFAGGTVDAIQKLTVKNLGTAEAKVKVALFL